MSTDGYSTITTVHFESRSISFYLAAKPICSTTVTTILRLALIQAMERWYAIIHQPVTHTKWPLRVIATHWSHVPDTQAKLNMNSSKTGHFNTACTSSQPQDAILSSPATHHKPSLKIFLISHRLTSDRTPRYFLAKIQEAFFTPCLAHTSLKTNAGWVNFRVSGFGGVEVAWWLFVPKFAGSHPAETVWFFWAKKSSARLPSEGK